MSRVERRWGEDRRRFHPMVASIALRVHAVPEDPIPPRNHPPRFRCPAASIGHRMLVIAMDDEERGARPFSFGIFQIAARQADGSYGWAESLRLTESMRGVVVGDGCSAMERRGVRAWAKRRGLRVLTVYEFVHEVFFPECHWHGTLGVAWDWGVLVGSLATDWTASSRSAETFAITLCPLWKQRRMAHSHNPSRHPRCPRVRVRRLTEPFVQHVEFASPWGRRGKQRWAPSPGRFLGLHEKAYVLSAESQTLASACRMLGLAAPADPASSSVEDRLDALARRVDGEVVLAAAVQRALLTHAAIVSDDNEIRRRRHRVPRLGVPDVHTPTTLGKQYLRAMGMHTPPSLRVASDSGLSDDNVHGAAMAAFFPGHTRLFVRNLPVSGVLADLGRQYPMVATNMGHWAWWTAETVEVVDATDAAQALLDRARPEDYLQREPWSVLNVLVLLQPDGDWLQARLELNGGPRKDEIVLDGPLTVPPSFGPIWTTLPDALVSVWRTGRAPRVLQAIRFVPRGRRPGLRRVRFSGGAVLDPANEVFADLVDLRVRFATEGASHLAQAAKVMANALAFGVTAELHAERVRDLVLHDGVRRYRTRARYEAPGPFYCPPLAALVTAGGRLQLFLLEYLAEQAGDRCAMVAVDSAFFTGADPVASYETVRDRIEPLNTSATARPLLRLDRAHGDPPRPLVFQGIAVSRYCIVDRNENNRVRVHISPEVAKSSGQVLGSILDPVTHAKSHLGVGTPDWWAEAWRWGSNTTKRGQRASKPSWLDHLAPFVVTLTTPEQAKEYRRLYGGVRPFQQVLLNNGFAAGGHLAPIAPLHLLDPRGNAARPWQDTRTMLPWRDARTGARLHPIRDVEEYEGGFFPETYRSLLTSYFRHADRKSPDGERCGWSERIYHVTASALRFRRKESVLPVGADDLGTLFGDQERHYEITDRRDADDAVRTLSPFAPHHLDTLANHLDVTPRRLRDVLAGRAHPRAGLRGRLIALAERIRRHGDLPSALRTTGDAKHTKAIVQGALRSLRGVGIPPREIAARTGASERTVRRWLAGDLPREAHRTRLIETALAMHTPAEEVSG